MWKSPLYKLSQQYIHKSTLKLFIVSLALLRKLFFNKRCKWPLSSLCGSAPDWQSSTFKVSLMEYGLTKVTHELFENYINFYTWSFTFRRTKVTVQVSEKQFHGLVGSVPVLLFHKLKWSKIWSWLTLAVAHRNMNYEVRWDVDESELSQQ